MNKNVFACLLTMLAAMFMFSSCEWMPGSSSGDDYVYYDIKPIRMDVQGVKGFVVAENAAASKADDDIFLMDMQTDTQGNPYLLYFKNSCMVVALLSDGQCQEVLTHPIEISGGYIGNQDDPIFMGNIDGAMHWIYGSNINGSGNPKDAQYKHVVYQPASNTFSMVDFKEDIEDMLSDAYDAFAMSDKVYAAKVSDQSIMVKEYDPLTRSSRQYTLDVDISNTIARQYSLVVQDAPYLIVTGRSTEDGTSVSFKINLLNGENNASFSPDARKVTSFFRIN